MDRLPRRSVHQRFWSKVSKSDGCWLWTGANNSLGYGQLSLDGGRRACAHRVAYEWTVGAIEPGLDLDHLCRNPSCVNPSHLEPVTHRENIRRGKAATKTACKYGHDWTDPRNVYIRKSGSRWCAECGRTRWSRKGRPREGGR
ncbi:MAG: HNH endonuclease signature motif containing protein [Candidatus Eiseniibacteriota bacterium]